MKKSIRVLAVLFALMFAFTAVFAVSAEEADASATPEIVILHTNDVHSRVDANLGYESVAGWKAYYESLGAAVIVLDAGDALHGFPIANLESGLNIVKIMNAVGYTAMTPGNHDFNYGTERLTELKAEMDFDLLSCNLKADSDGSTLLNSYKIYEAAGKKIAVIGISTPETATKTNPSNVKGYNFDADSIASDVQAAIDAAKSEGADFVVALGHLGVDSQSEPWRSTDIIPQVSGLDVFIDGHSHTDTVETVVGKDGKNVILTQTGSYIASIGCVTLTGGVIEATKLTEKKENQEVHDLIAKMQEEIKPLMDKVVAKTEVVLDGERAPGVRTQETNLGDLAADALLYASGADVALTNGGGIRITINTGDITVGDLNAVFPFGNVVTTVRVKGSDIVAALENGCKDLPGASGGFPQVAGVTFEIHAYEPSGSRIKNVMVGGKELDPDAEYTLVTNDFTAAGGDGYTMLSQYPTSGAYGALDEALVSFISEKLGGKVGSEYAESSGRIVIYNTPDDVPTPDTSDNGVIVFAVVSLMSLMAAAAVIKKRLK